MVVPEPHQGSAADGGHWLSGHHAGRQGQVGQIKQEGLSLIHISPLIMFYVMKHEFPYGMMVTASHNPALYNLSLIHI